MSTAFAMDVPPVSVNNVSCLQTKWRTPKAGVTGSNPVGRAKIKMGVNGSHFILVGSAKDENLRSTKRQESRFGSRSDPSIARAQAMDGLHHKFAGNEFGRAKRAP